jgi:two-component system, LytTR family, response regulator
MQTINYNSGPRHQPDLLILPTNRGVREIEISTIIRIQSNSNYSKLFFSNGQTLVVAKVLAWFGGKLPDCLFIRVHRSHLISLRYVQASCNHSSNKIILRDNTAIDVSRRKKGMVMRIFRNLQAA